MSQQNPALRYQVGQDVLHRFWRAYKLLPDGSREPFPIGMATQGDAQLFCSWLADAYLDGFRDGAEQQEKFQAQRDARRCRRCHKDTDASAPGGAMGIQVGDAWYHLACYDEILGGRR